MGVRNGAEFIAGLKAHPRDVWIAGRQVRDVTADAVFRRPITSLGGLFDQQVRPDLGDVMTYRTEDGDRAGLSFLVPRSREDLVRRRRAMEVWAEATFGLMGRSPDYMNTLLVAFSESLEFFAQGGARFAENVQRYYRRCRDNDLFLTHAIVNPQTDRSKSSAQQAEPFIHLGVGQGDQRRANRARCQDAGNAWSDGGRAARLSGAV
jgi:anthranilate 3-monooxygenase (FAD)/4-hydroxyphenylacetate 3-monooxygenase